MIRVVLFDLDGVVRHFDPRDVADIERRYGLAPGSIPTAAFASPLIEQVTTGRISRAEWVGEVGRMLGDAGAAAEWGRLPARVDPEITALSDELQALGLTTAILTNGTDTIPAEVIGLGLDAHFDRVFNSAEIGFAKPDVRAYTHVVDELATDAAEVFFTDDSEGKLAGARRIGMPVHRFRGVERLRAALREVSVPV